MTRGRSALLRPQTLGGLTLAPLAFAPRRGGHGHSDLSPSYSSSRRSTTTTVFVEQVVNDRLRIDGFEQGIPMEKVETRKGRCRSTSEWRSIMARHEASGLSGDGSARRRASARARSGAGRGVCRTRPRRATAERRIWLCVAADGHAALVRRPGGAGAQPPGGSHRRVVVRLRRLRGVRAVRGEAQRGAARAMLEPCQASLRAGDGRGAGGRGHGAGVRARASA